MNDKDNQPARVSSDQVDRRQIENLSINSFSLCYLPFASGSWLILIVAFMVIYVVESDGKFGRWDHEMTDSAFVSRMISKHGMDAPDDGAVFLVGEFNDFLNYVIAETGIA